jgi:hypothetical protein
MAKAKRSSKKSKRASKAKRGKAPRPNRKPSRKSKTTDKAKARRTPKSSRASQGRQVARKGLSVARRKSRSRARSDGALHTTGVALTQIEKSLAAAPGDVPRFNVTITKEEGPEDLTAVVIGIPAPVLIPGQDSSSFTTTSPFRLMVSATGDPGLVKLALSHCDPDKHVGDMPENGGLYEGQTQHEVKP